MSELRTLEQLPPKAGWIVWDKREGILRNDFTDCELAWTNQDSPAYVAVTLEKLKGLGLDVKRLETTNGRPQD